MRDAVVVGCGGHSATSASLATASLVRRGMKAPSSAGAAGATHSVSPPVEMAPRTIAGVNCNVKAGHGQVEGDVPVAARVHVSGAHGEKDAPCRGVFRQRHLEEEEALVTWALSPFSWSWTAGLGESLELARAAMAGVSQCNASQGLPHLCTKVAPVGTHPTCIAHSLVCVTSELLEYPGTDLFLC